MRPWNVLVSAPRIVATRARKLRMLASKYPQQAATLFALVALYVLFNVNWVSLAPTSSHATLHIATSWLFGTSHLGSAGRVLVTALAVVAGQWLLREHRTRADLQAQRRLAELNLERESRARQQMQKHIAETAKLLAQSRTQAEEVDAARMDKLAEDNSALAAQIPQGQTTARQAMQAVHQAGVAALTAQPTKAPVALAPANGAPSQSPQREARTAQQLRYETLQQQADETLAAHLAQQAMARAAQAAAAESQRAAASSVRTESASGGNAADAAANRASSKSQHLPGPTARGTTPPPQPTPSTSSSTSSMIPLSVAQEAEARQKAWLEQLSAQISSPSPGLANERIIREQQDAEYVASLQTDRERAAARQAARAAEAETARKAEETRKQQTKRLMELATMKESIRLTLPPEPPLPSTIESSRSKEGDEKEDKEVEQIARVQEEGEEGAKGGTYSCLGGQEQQVVVVRVRLPDGSSHTRRWLEGAEIDLVHQWVQSLEAMPLWEPESWSLAVTYPRAVLPLTLTVGSAAGGHGTVALLVERA